MQPKKSFPSKMPNRPFANLRNVIEEHQNKKPFKVIIAPGGKIVAIKK